MDVFVDVQQALVPRPAPEIDVVPGQEGLVIPGRKRQASREQDRRTGDRPAPPPRLAGSESQQRQPHEHAERCGAQHGPAAAQRGQNQEAGERRAQNRSQRVKGIGRADPAAQPLLAPAQTVDDNWKGDSHQKRRYRHHGETRRNPRRLPEIEPGQKVAGELEQIRQMVPERDRRHHGYPHAELAARQPRELLRGTRGMSGQPDAAPGDSEQEGEEHVAEGIGTGADNDTEQVGPDYFIRESNQPREGGGGQQQAIVARFRLGRPYRRRARLRRNRCGAVKTQGANADEAVDQNPGADRAVDPGPG